MKIKNNQKKKLEMIVEDRDFELEKIVEQGEGLIKAKKRRERKEKKG